MIQLHFKDVSKFFGETIAVDHVTLDVEEGELFFLLGPSGCGKSTFLRTIAGFYQPDTGELYFDDRLMNDVPPHKRNIGMVFQNYALWPHMTVYQNVEYGLNVRKLPDEEKKKRVYEVLEIVRMEKYATRNPNQLSGGQQQRIALARALVIEPDVLLLDEPLSNLDAKLRLEMRKEIKRIHSEAGITSVYVTHDQKEALSLADRAAVMENGKIIQVGNPRQIYNLPINKFVAGFIGETNFIDGKVKSTSSKDIIMDTEIGEIHSIFADHDFNSDENVTCSVRPESIIISENEKENIPNQFAATISSVIYLGDVEEYWLDVADTWEIKAVLHNPGQQERKSGDQVYINFQPLDAVCLPVET
ncbi:polyamine ABC transporter ATP-binding protein [Candidatus Poribacteria bacterium]|nr:polyamine ABC transporter ATP-binding protein [Candidatus Poribacteria bacterium]